MGASYYVAVRQACWPTIDALNECLADLHYPVRLPKTLNAMETPVAESDGSLIVEFEGKPIHLEAEITRLSINEPFAYDLRIENDRTFDPTDVADLVPLDLNAELAKLGVIAPNFEYGDYVLALTFRSSIDEWKAGFLLMSGLIRYADGLGFEFDEAIFGDTSFANKLVREAAEME